jgi:hypothetical protein
MEFLKADKAEMKAEKKADKAEMMAEMKTQIGCLAYKMEAKMDDNKEEMKHAINSLRFALEGAINTQVEMKACREVTHACLEEKEPTPEKTEAVAEPHEVPKGATDAETIGATEDRSRDLRLAVSCHRELRTWTKRDGRVRQEHAAVGRPTRHTVPAMRKGGLCKGPGRMCCRSCIGGQSKASPSRKSGRITKWDQQPAMGYQNPLKWQTQDVVQGTPEGRTCKNRRRTRPECNNGIRDSGARPPTSEKGEDTQRGHQAEPVYGDGKVSSRVFHQTTGTGTLWKCRPPLKRKR